MELFCAISSKEECMISEKYLISNFNVIIFSWSMVKNYEQIQFDLLYSRYLQFEETEFNSAGIIKLTACPCGAKSYFSLSCDLGGWLVTNSCRKK